VRPLLPFSREIILRYAKKNELHWREDSSNASQKYLRNALRHTVVPSFKEAAPQVLEQLQKTQKHLIASQSLIDDYLALIYNLVIAESPEGYTLSIAKLRELPNTEALLYELLHPFGFTAWEDITNLLSAQTGKKVLSGTHRLIRNRDHLLLTERPYKAESSSEEKEEMYQITQETIQIDRPIKMSFHRVDEVQDLGKNTIFVDGNLLQYPLVLRHYRQGDVFQPFGMTGKKKLSKFFKDEKLSLASKEKIWLLCNADQIVWVIGLRPDDRYKVADDTSQILKITVSL
jgi:tRNA(Ile)-lysidine synthase